MPDAVWKIDRISTEYKRIGFFRVQLLPVLVVEGIHLELTPDQLPQTNWLDGFQCGMGCRRRTGARSNGGTSTSSFPREKIPCLHASRAHPMQPTPERFFLCQLEGVTLQAGAGPIHLARAEVRAEGSRPGKSLGRIPAR